jgi:hydroxymethylglutaryl-CoA synthase
MRGILAAAGYVPYRRLQRSGIRDVLGSGGGKGTRSVASFDEDTTTMAVEAARNLGPLDASPASLWFATAEPAYLDKTNANAIHTALRLDPDVAAMDAGGAIRSGVGALKAALESNGTILVLASDVRTGLPGSTDESQGGDGAAAVLVGDGDVVAEYIGGASATREFLERWRTPGSSRSRTWEDRFGESMYAPLAEQAWNAALKSADVTDVDVLAVAGMHARSVGRVSKRLGVANTIDLSDTVGDTGTAHALLLLTSALETADTDQIVAVVALADGADVLLFKTRSTPTPRRRVDAMVAQASDVSYSRFLSWKGMLTPEPPNRPEPARVSAPAAERGSDWKYGFVDHDRPLAESQGTIVTFTVDRLAYSPSPPIVFAIVDFDAADGEQTRFPLELTDVDAEQLKVGDRVEMTFRKLSTADGIHNYFWKAKPVRGGGWASTVGGP